MADMSLKVLPKKQPQFWRTRRKSQGNVSDLKNPKIPFSVARMEMATNLYSDNRTPFRKLFDSMTNKVLTIFQGDLKPDMK
ncbi:hypothetical protein BGX31_005882 [Mortierella sp. GBA43]|nr:hypothetical protein BGX31_005882 [Mortierella sp. GBA43]